MGNNYIGKKYGKLQPVAMEECVLSYDKGKQNRELILREPSRKLKVVKNQ